MEGNARTWFTPKQRAELWQRSEHKLDPKRCRPPLARATKILHSSYSQSVFYTTKIQS